MNKKLFIALAAVIIGAFVLERTFFSLNKSSIGHTNPTIGIVVPLTHPALEKVVAGFCDELTNKLNVACTFLIRDAHGDQNVQQPAIIDEMKYKNVDLIVPIGTLCTQMTLQKAPKISTIALATSPETITKSSNATGVHDEIEAHHTCSFIQSILPKLSKIALIATQTEKTMPSIELFRHEALNRGITVQTIYVQTPSDVYLATHSIDADAQAIHILKDHLVVNSVATIIQFAQTKKIPLIASDEGSVSSGAACALGVQEETIGRVGAQLAAQVLAGKVPSDVPVQSINKLAIFINKKACLKQALQPSDLEHYAKKQSFDCIHLKQIMKDLS